MPSLILTGHKYGRLLVTDLNSYKSTGWRRYWNCFCDCGQAVTIRTDNLRSGRAQSCGCLQKEIVSNICKKTKTTHGKANSKVYWAWGHIHARCYNPKCLQYKNYGGRGITVCERWHKFENFLADMGEPPTLQHSIDRINNNGNYDPKNCRWATHEEQSNNRRTNKYYFFNGEHLTLSQWSKKVNIDYNALYKRIQMKWSIEDTLQKKSKKDTRMG